MGLGEYGPALLSAGASVAIFLLGGYAIVIRNDMSAKQTQKQVEGMATELKSLTVVITKQAVQEERLNEQSRRMRMLEEQVDRMRRGQGYEQARTSVDGEY